MAEPLPERRLRFAAVDETGRGVGAVVETAGRSTWVGAVALGFDPVRIGLVADGIPARPRWEHRHDGIWIDANRESFGWSFGLEAFALGVDRPDDLVTVGIGHRVPLGWELDVDRSGSASGLILGPWGEEPFDGVGVVDGGEGAAALDALLPLSVGAASTSTGLDVELPGPDGVRWRWVAAPGSLRVTRRR